MGASWAASRRCCWSASGGFAFVLLAAVIQPGLQTIVGAWACPDGGRGSVVVRYPHVDEPPAMIRNTPLVCLGPGDAVLASHGRVLPSLFVVGAALTAVDVAIGSALVAAASRRRDPRPQPPRRAIDSIRFLPLLLATPFVGLTVFAAYWWLAVDTPYWVSGCRSSGGGSATCYDGEPVHRLLTFLFGALALAGLVVWFVLLVRTRDRHHRVEVTDDRDDPGRTGFVVGGGDAGSGRDAGQPPPADGGWELPSSND